MKPILAKSFAGQDPSGWLMSEKLDGVRAIWDGRQLLSRNGNVFPAPAAFLATLPPIPLDGELWMGRGQFQATLSAVKRGDFSGLKYVVFDAPAHPGGFYERLIAAATRLDGSPHSVLDHFLCRDQAHLEKRLAQIIGEGGEGVMLRAPGGLYRAGRSPDLLKLKPVDDSEGEMIGTEPGAGKYDGQVGALLLQWGRKIVKVGSGLTDDLRTAPPVLGARVTFAYNGLTDSGQPRFPVFRAVRNYE